MQGDAADQLHVEVTHAEGAARGLAHGGESLRNQLLEGRAGGEALTKLLGLAAQLLVGERLHGGLERVRLRAPSARNP